MNVRVRYNSNMNATAAHRIPEGNLPEETYLRIGEVAELTGLTQRTIRYYEELGLLPPPTRTHGDFRLFSAGDISRLAEIVRLKKLLGFSLSEIKEIVEGEETRSQLRDQYRATDDAATRLRMLEEATGVVENQLALIERKMAQMVEMRSDLLGRINRFAAIKKELMDKIKGAAAE